MTALAQEIESKYEVLQKMGEGGMGAVYKVRHRFLDDIQVIKLMQAKFSENAELKTRFLREAKTAKQLRHPNIAEVIDFNLTSDGTAYIVMEFIEGVNLGEVLARTQGPLDYRLVVMLARQALTALAFLHRKKFVHRDISPDNLMLTRDAEGEVLVKLIDLGITKSIEETRNLTMAGKFIGKVQYASPEQFGGDVDRRSDLYSFGVVLYELLTGIKPIGGSDYFSIITGHMTRPPRPFEETDPNARVPPVLRQAVLKALEKDPANRFQDADEFADALKELDVGNFDATVEVPLPAAIAALPGEGGDAMERADWDAASASDTMKAWESYVDRHGNSSRAGRARARLEQLEHAEEADWNTASRSESSDAWRRYLDKHADSPRAAMARRRLEKMHAAEVEERAWNDALAANSASSWDFFIAVHPDSPHIEEARQALAATRERAEEDRAWRGAESSDSTGGWRYYLETYPASHRSEDARARLRSAEGQRQELLAWERAAASDSSDGWRGFIRDHSRSARTREANENLTRALEREAAEKRAEEAERQQRLEEEAWERASRQASAAGWELFVRDYPRSDRLGDAMKRLADIRENERKAAERTERERKRAAEDEAWVAACTARMTGEVRAFVDQYPKSRHSGEAKALLGLLAEEQRLAEQRAEEKRAEAQRVLKAREEKARAEDRRAQQQREEEALAAKREQERHEQESLEQQRAEEQRAEEKRAAQRAEEKREKARREEERAQAARAEEQRRIDAQRERERAAPIPQAPLAPVTQPELPTAAPVQPLSEPAPSRMFGRPAALAAVILLVIAITVIVLVTGKDETPSPPPVVEVVETQSPVFPPASATGDLVIHAAPWGEVRSIKDAEGREHLSGRPVYTPVTLSLPAGAYRVELTNPNSGRTSTVSTTVEAGRIARCEAELDDVDAEAYLKRVLEARR
ncbi:MAG: protein kinase [Acidobacteriota bacterium]